MVHAALRQARIFDLLDDRDLEELATLGEERDFAATETLFREHDPADSLFVVLKGRVSSVLRERGQVLELDKHLPGNHFSKIVLIEGQLCYTSAVALTSGRVFVLSGRGCAALLARTARERKAAAATRVSSPRLSAPSLLDVTRSQGPSEGDFVRIRSISSAVAGVAHEINTPLGVIENAASFVTEQLGSESLRPLLEQESGELLADVAEACQLIRKNVAHAARLVQSFKKLSVGQLAEPRERLDLVRLIHEVLNVFRSKALSAIPPGPRSPTGASGQHRLFLASSRLEIKLECSLVEAERSWDGFPSLFSRVLLNLLTNIDRYAYPGDQPGKVVIALTRVMLDSGLPGFQITVRDFGRGIPLADLPHVFDPFFTTGRDRGGTGLGLAMVHNLVTQGFDGSVRVESAVGEGTTFELRFPERAPDHAPVTPSPP